MIETRENCRDLLRCPRTGARLEPDGQDALAPVADHRYRYPIVRGVPVLLDFEDSVIDEGAILATAADSPIRRSRHHGIKRLIKRLLSPPKKATRDNVRIFATMLKAANPHPRLLMVGGGTVGQGMQPLYDDPDVRVMSFDIYHSPDVHFVADAHKIPLPDGVVDGVVIQAVLEHVLLPAGVVAEIWRVLKDRGLVYAETPFLQQVHEGPYDFTRFTESGHRYLFRRFELIRSGPSAGAGTQLLWSLDYFARGLFRSVAAGKIVKLAFFWLNYVDRLIPTRYAIDSASGVYFMGRKAHIEVTPPEIIAYYRGAQRR